MLLALEDIGEVGAGQCEGYRGSYDPVYFFKRSLTAGCRMDSREFKQSKGGPGRSLLSVVAVTDSQVRGGGGASHRQAICPH